MDLFCQLENRPAGLDTDLHQTRDLIRWTQGIDPGNGEC